MSLKFTANTSLVHAELIHDIKVVNVNGLNSHQTRHLYARNEFTIDSCQTGHVPYTRGLYSQLIVVNMRGMISRLIVVKVKDTRVGL